MIVKEILLDNFIVMNVLGLRRFTENEAHWLIYSANSFKIRPCFKLTSVAFTEYLSVTQKYRQRDQT